MSKSEIDELNEKVDRLVELVESISYSLKGVEGSKGIIQRVDDLEVFAKKNNLGKIIQQIIISITSVLGTVGVLIATKMIGG